MSNISENIKGLLEQTEFSASKKKRLRLIAVSKRKSLENMKDAVSGGVTALGENRIQEAVEKFSKENFP
ncbi:MAG: YggS family pyridoxal phosphate enzyme, partial [Candidatus Marinimicrobia bacterium]|nr:YggS family pyridoxal phosphate enzyme [Candidatus Neomarinimicrobiota bacterium]